MTKDLSSIEAHLEAQLKKPNTKAEREAFAEMLEMQFQLQDKLKEMWSDSSLPNDWKDLDSRDPITPHRDRVTLRLDRDMLRWFRKIGPGYQMRINQILRIYWKGVMSGKVTRHYDEYMSGPHFRV